MSDENVTPRVTETPAGNNVQTDREDRSADHIANPAAYEASQEAKRRRLENKELKATVEQLTSKFDQLLSVMAEERKAREEAERKASEAQATAKRQQAITDVANRFKLPPQLAERLRGNTPEELEADAAELAKLLPSAPTQSAPQYRVANTPANAAPTPKAEIMARLRANTAATSPLYDINLHMQKGGGIVEE